MIDSTSLPGPDSRAVTALLDGTVTDTATRVLQHVLLSTDGTVVRLLEGCFGEPIRLADHVQCTRPAAPTDPAELELSEDETVLHRKVLLQGRRTGGNYVSADSLIAIDRLDPPVRDALLSTSLPIGKILVEHRVESFREILRIGRTRAQRSGMASGEELLFRTYRIVIGGRPAMLITEEFSASSLSEGAGGSSRSRGQPQDAASERASAAAEPSATAAPQP